MEDPVLYRQSNGVLRRDEKKIIDEYANMIHLRPDGKDTLIDVGCGPGDVLVDLIRPILPKNHGKILGTDVSPKMIEHARKHFANHDRVEFDVLDIGAERLPEKYREKFNHVTSFYCLHWIQDQRRALKNIYDLLTPGGDCMIIFLGYTTLFHGYEHLAENPRWAKYMFDLKDVIPPSQKHEDLWTFYTNLFKDIGFVSENIEIRQRAFVYQGLATVTDHLASVNAFIHRVPSKERKEYISDLRKFFENMGLAEDEKYVIPHKLVVAFARKPSIHKLKHSALHCKGIPPN